MLPPSKPPSYTPEQAGSHGSTDGVSRDRGQPRGSYGGKLGVVEGWEARAVRISSPHMNLQEGEEKLRKPLRASLDQGSLPRSRLQQGLSASTACSMAPDALGGPRQGAECKMGRGQVQQLLLTSPPLKSTHMPVNADVREKAQFTGVLGDVAGIRVDEDALRLASLCIGHLGVGGRKYSE